MSVPEQLKQLMDQRHLTIYSLAQKSELHWQTIKNLFSRTSNPTVSTMEKICKGLNITMAQFFKTEDESLHFVTAEQAYLLGRWESISDEDKETLNKILDTMIKANGTSL